MESVASPSSVRPSSARKKLDTARFTDFVLNEEKSESVQLERKPIWNTASDFARKSIESGLALRIQALTPRK